MERSKLSQPSKDALLSILTGNGKSLRRATQNMIKYGQPLLTELLLLALVHGTRI